MTQPQPTQTTTQGEAMERNEITILLDMDGVVADFVGGAIEATGLPMKAEDVRAWDFFDAHMAVDDFWEAIADTPGFWRKLDKYTWVAELWQLLNDTGCNIVFASSPCADPKSAAQKLEWLNGVGLMGHGGTNYMLGHNKWLMARRDAILIDDSDWQVRAFRRRGGPAILFPQLWNNNRAQCSTRMAFVRAAVKRYLAAIQQQAPTPAPTEDVLTEATRVVQERGSNYGHPREHFARTVGQINSLFAHKLREPFEPHEWAQMMIADKNARIVNNPTHRDNWVDIPGYSNCGHQCPPDGGADHAD